MLRFTVGGTGADQVSASAAREKWWGGLLGGSFNLAADGNGNGMIDAGDYSVWTSHFGTVLPGAGAGEGAAGEAGSRERGAGSGAEAFPHADPAVAGVAGSRVPGAAVVFAFPHAEPLFAFPHTECAGNRNVADMLRVSKGVLGVPPAVRNDALLVWLAERANVTVRPEVEMSRAVATHEQTFDATADDGIELVDEVFAGLAFAL